METPAVGMTEIPGRGRAMVALRPIKGGEIILRDSPILLYSALPFHSDNHLNNNNNNPYCSNCFTTISQPPQAVPCSTCASQFCTLACQSAASTTSHTPWVCQTLIRLRDYFSGNRVPLDVQIQTRFVVSAYNLATVSQSKFQTLLSLQGSVDSVNSVASQSDVVSETDASFINSVICSVCPPLPVQFGFSLELTKVLLAKDKLNAFGLMEPFSEQNADRSVRAYGIYPVASFFNHDCLPNACRFDYLDADKSSSLNNNTEMVIRMIHDVPQGREVCLSYFPVNWKYSERQKRLREDYGFVCDCDRCKVEAGWSESDGDELAMDDDEGNDEGTMDEDVDERMEGEDGDVMKGDDDFPHAYFFLNYMCDRTNCWGTLAPLPPSVGTTSGVMECNVCGGFKKLDQMKQQTSH
ncbi:putative [histone H3]-lysine(4) N-trimethyltransferase chromatin remodeling SET family [Helianthus annuus]|nr:putative [histone H3]-lysine(4) N-trimethyltransferase chromatin remodeling SET family [Helianthus annuus]